jgi:hypothetical protein
MKFRLLHSAIKGMPVVSLNTVTRAIHIRLLTRQIHNARILPTAVASRPARLRHSLPAAALLFSSPTAPYVTTVTGTRLLACGRRTVGPSSRSSANSKDLSSQSIYSVQYDSGGISIRSYVEFEAARRFKSEPRRIHLLLAQDSTGPAELFP